MACVFFKWEGRTNLRLLIIQADILRQTADILGVCGCELYGKTLTGRGKRFRHDRIHDIHGGHIPPLAGFGQAGRQHLCLPTSSATPTTKRKEKPACFLGFLCWRTACWSARTTACPKNTEKELLSAWHDLLFARYHASRHTSAPLFCATLLCKACASWACCGTPSFTFSFLLIQ